MSGPARFIYPVVIATIMSFLMSGLITAVNLGLGAGFLVAWMQAWSVGLPMAAVAVLFAAPLAAWITRGIVALFFSKRKERKA